MAGIIHVRQRDSAQPISGIPAGLYCENAPLIRYRYRMRDLVRFNRTTCFCVSTSLRLVGGILGRSDDIFHFAGGNIFPGQIQHLTKSQLTKARDFLIEAVKYRITVTPEVEVCEIGALPRVEGKAKRLIREA